MRQAAAAPVVPAPAVPVPAGPSSALVSTFVDPFFRPQRLISLYLTFCFAFFVSYIKSFWGLSSRTKTVCEVYLDSSIAKRVFVTVARVIYVVELC
jgi:hypothetical protein